MRRRRTVDLCARPLAILAQRLLAARRHLRVEIKHWHRPITCPPKFRALRGDGIDVGGQVACDRTSLGAVMAPSPRRSPCGRYQQPQHPMGFPPDSEFSDNLVAKVIPLLTLAFRRLAYPGAGGSMSQLAGLIQLADLVAGFRDRSSIGHQTRRIPFGLRGYVLAGRREQRYIRVALRPYLRAFNPYPGAWSRCGGG